MPEFKQAPIKTKHGYVKSAQACGLFGHAVHYVKCSAAKAPRQPLRVHELFCTQEAIDYHKGAFQELKRRRTEIDAAARRA